jgi:hypothetical protein
MKSTWKKSDSPQRRNLGAGFALFVIGVGVTAYCGYMERYIGDPQPDVLKLLGWGLLFIGFVLFVLGILQSPIQRE